MLELAKKCIIFKQFVFRYVLVVFYKAKNLLVLRKFKSAPSMHIMHIYNNKVLD